MKQWHEDLLAKMASGKLVMHTPRRMGKSRMAKASAMHWKTHRFSMLELGDKYTEIRRYFTNIADLSMETKMLFELVNNRQEQFKRKLADEEDIFLTKTFARLLNIKEGYDENTI